MRGLAYSGFLRLVALVALVALRKSVSGPYLGFTARVRRTKDMPCQTAHSTHTTPMFISKTRQDRAGLRSLFVIPLFLTLMQGLCSR